MTRRPPRSTLFPNATLFRSMPSFSLRAAVLGTPDPRGLARFYQRLLGWPLRDDTDEWATLRPADGGTGLSFQLERDQDRKSTRLNSSHANISYAVFCLKKTH